MTEKVLEFEAGTSGDNVTAGAGNISGLNTVAVNAGSAKYDSSVAFYGGVGVLVTNAAGSNAIIRLYIDAPGTTAATTATKMSYTFCVTLPSTVPGESETFAQLRFLPSSGGSKFAYHTDGTIRFFDGVSGSSGIVAMSSADRAALAGRQLRATLTADAASPNSVTAAAVSLKFYNNAGAQVGSTYTGTMNLIGVGAGTGQAGMDLGRIAGLTSARAYGFDHFGISDGVLTEIGSPTTRLTTPVLTITDQTQPLSSSGTEGSVTVTWPAVSGATRYDAYRATVTTPTQGDYVLWATGITSPYQFTGQGAGTYWFGIKAVP